MTIGIAASRTELHHAPRFAQASYCLFAWEGDEEGVVVGGGG